MELQIVDEPRDQKSEMDVVKEARELLKNATMGPWKQSALAGGYVIGPKEAEYQTIAALVEYNQDGSVYLEFRNGVNNMALITRAPELLSALCDEVDALRNENAELKKCDACERPAIDRNCRTHR